MANDVTIRMGLDKSAVEAGLRGVSANVNAFGQEMLSSFKGMFAIGAVIASLKELGDSMVALKREAQDQGTDVGFLQTLQKLAVRFGSTAEDANTALSKLNIKIGEAEQKGSSAANMFENLGISLYGKNGELRSTQEIFLDIAEPYKKTEGSATRTALANDIFSRSGLRINNILEQGADGLKKFNAEMEKSGKVVSTENVDNIAEAWLNLKQSAAGVGNVIASVVGQTYGAFSELRQLWSDEEAGLDEVMSDVEARNLMFHNRKVKAVQAEAIAARLTVKQREAVIKIEKELGDIIEKRLFSEMSSVEKVAYYEKKRADSIKDLADARKKHDPVAVAEAELDLTKQTLAVMDARNEMEKQSLSIAEKRAAWGARALEYDKARAEVGKFSLKELAELEFSWLDTKEARQDKINAREIMALEAQAREAEKVGNNSKAKQLRDSALSLRGQTGMLNESDRNPFSRELTAASDSAIDAFEAWDAQQKKYSPKEIMDQKGAIAGQTEELKLQKERAADLTLVAIESRKSGDAVRATRAEIRLRETNENIKYLSGQINLKNVDLAKMEQNKAYQNQAATLRQVVDIMSETGVVIRQIVNAP